MLNLRTMAPLSVDLLRLSRGGDGHRGEQDEVAILSRMKDDQGPIRLGEIRKPDLEPTELHGGRVSFASMGKLDLQGEGQGNACCQFVEQLAFLVIKSLMVNLHPTIVASTNQ